MAYLGLGKEVPGEGRQEAAEQELTIGEVKKRDRTEERHRAAGVLNNAPYKYPKCMLLQQLVVGKSARLPEAVSQSGRCTRSTKATAKPKCKTSGFHKSIQ